MPPRPRSPRPRHEILAFVLAGLLALAVVALSGWGSESDAPDGAEPVGQDAPIASPSVDP